MIPKPGAPATCGTRLEGWLSNFVRALHDIKLAWQQSAWYSTSSLLPRFYFVTEYARVRATDLDFDHTEVDLRPRRLVIERNHDHFLFPRPDSNSVDTLLRASQPKDSVG